jgi:hypothetical protein
MLDRAWQWQYWQCCGRLKMAEEKKKLCGGDATQDHV